MKALERFRPSRRNPWDERKAAHLLNRAGFGGTPEEVRDLTRGGFDRAVHRLVHYEGIQDTGAGPEWLGKPYDVSPELLEEVVALQQDKRKGKAPVPAPVPAPAVATGKNGKQLTPQMMLNRMFQRQNGQRVQQMQGWWLDRMAHSPRPLQEKMTLFWHGHFATEAKKVRLAALLYQHNQLLRQNATGSFRDLVVGVSKDPAMLIYLDNHTNRKAHPNENYARELMELFTLGIGHYTEQDVREGARAFTGWTLGLDGGPYYGGIGGGRLLQALNQGRQLTFYDNAQQHDDGTKTYLGETGNLDGMGAIDAILRQPACAEFIADKLCRFLLTDDTPDPVLVQEMADLFRKSRYQIKPVLDALFRSRYFYSDAAIGSQIKSPIQLVVGAVRQLNADLQPNMALAGAAGQMGQIPLDPPNVKGWDGGRTWINTATLLARYNFSRMLVHGGPAYGWRARAKQAPAPAAGPWPRPRQGIESRVDLRSLVTVDPLQDPQRAVEEMTARLLTVPLTGAQTAQLQRFASGGTGDPEAWLAELAHLLMSTPNYQLC